MERLVIAENIRPLSVNDGYEARAVKKGSKYIGLMVKTGDYKRFKTNMLERLEGYADKKEELLNTIKETKFYLETTLKVFTPKEKMFTLKDDISRNKGDCGNYRKCVQDVIFDWLGIDDKYTISEHNYQISDDQGIWGFEFTIEVKLR